MAALGNNRETLLTIREAAKALGYSPQHTRLLIRTGKLRGMKMGRDWAINESDVRAFAARRRIVGLRLGK